MTDEPDREGARMSFAGTMAYGTLWQLLFPLSFFLITIVCMFFIGDGLRDALDPKDR